MEQIIILNLIHHLPEYNNITKLSSNILYKIFTYVDDYNTILYNLDTIYDSNINSFIINTNSHNKYYKYPIFNYYITDLNKLNILHLIY